MGPDSPLRGSHLKPRIHNQCKARLGLRRWSAYKDSWPMAGDVVPGVLWGVAAPIPAKCSLTPDIANNSLSLLKFSRGAFSPETPPGSFMVVVKESVLVGTQDHPKTGRHGRFQASPESSRESEPHMCLKFQSCPRHELFTSFEDTSSAHGSIKGC